MNFIQISKIKLANRTTWFRKQTIKLVITATSGLSVVWQPEQGALIPLLKSLQSVKQ